MKEKLKKVINDALIKLDVSDVDITIEVPKDSNNGDFSSNIAMQLSRVLKKNPVSIAGMIKDNINSDDITKIDIAGPGFLNFFVKKDYLFDNMNKVLELGDNYGSSNIGEGKKINLEYVSANPTGFLHIGHARGAAYGDSLANIMRFAGFDVTREYYINDAGNQINNIEKLIEVARDIYNEYGGSAPEDIFRKKGVDFLLRKIKSDLKDFRVDFDIWSSETDLYKNGEVDYVLNKLKETGNTYEADNALFLKTTLYGDEKDRVLVKSDNNNTYLLPDISYHLNKYKRGYDKLIDVFGADHHGYINRLKAALTMLGEDADKLEIKILQMVRLLKGGEEIKLSKRTGKTLTLADLLSEVGVDAARYFFSSRSLDTQLDFDMDLATSKTNENPVYYVSYAHARICSILNEYNKETTNTDYKTLDSVYAYNLATKIYEFSEVVSVSALKEQPHIVTNYVYELAQCFHTFYAHEKVLTDDTNYTLDRINLIKACKITIKNALSLIGVNAPDKM